MPKLSAELDVIRRRALGGAHKKSPWGTDLDLETFLPAPRGGAVIGCCDETLQRAGIEPGGAGRAGTYLQADREVLLRTVGDIWRDKVEIMPVAEALASRASLAETWWKLVGPGTDKYTARVALHEPEGYYLGIKPGAVVEETLQTCFLIARRGTLQCVHNVIIVGEGASAHLITGCASPPAVGEGLHLGVTECLVGRNASLTFTMIHHWGAGFHVRPRSAAVVEEGGTFVSHYILLTPLRSIQTFPTVILKGAGARCRCQSLVSGRGRSELDIGSRVVHEGDDTGSEIVSRTVASEESSITARGRIEASTDRCRGHLECLGMIRSREASIDAVPELIARGAPHAELSHEAAISPIAEEEVAYLMSRGMCREEAVATIMRGFLDVDILGLPEALRRTVEESVRAL